MLRNRPRFAVNCGRCGKPREGLRHVCVSNSKRSATLKPTITFGKCPTCKKTISNPLTHKCKPKSDFKARKSKAAKREREKATKKRKSGQHPFESCRDSKCQRPQCVAYRSGWHDGHFAGFEQGYERGYAIGYQEGYGAGKAAGFAEGFKAGLASCPGPHGGK